jgi:hypothetical protein
VVLCTIVVNRRIIWRMRKIALEVHVKLRGVPKKIQSILDVEFREGGRVENLVVFLFCLIILGHIKTRKV